MRFSFLDNMNKITSGKPLNCISYVYVCVWMKNEKPCERDAVEFLKREHDFWYCAEWGGVKKSYLQTFCLLKFHEILEHLISHYSYHH